MLRKRKWCGGWPSHPAGVFLENLEKISACHSGLDFVYLETHGDKLLREVLVGVGAGTRRHDKQTQNHHG